MFKNTMSKVILGFFLYLFLLCININSVDAKNKVTQTIDLTSLTTDEDKLEEEGWSWDSDTKTLVLDGITIEITDPDGKANECIKFNRGEDTTIIFRGKNNLIADKGYSLYGVYTEGDGTLTLKGEENAVLNLSYKMFKNTYPGNNGTTIGYPHNLVIESGTINSQGTIIVDDTFTMKGGNFNLESWDTDDSAIYALQQVNIIGGNLNIASKGTAIMVPGEKKETDKADGVVINGGNVFLDSKEGKAICTGYPNPSPEGKYTKNVVINGGNITLGGEDGIEVRKGSIIVNKVDSADVSNVRKDVLKVYDMEGNYILCPKADYSKVDEAIDKANALNKDDYKDFSAVEEAIYLIERDKNLLEQKQVDTMVDNINSAIANLELKYEPKPREPEESDSSDIDNPNTYDSFSKYIIYFSLSVVGLGFSMVIYKKELMNN